MGPIGALTTESGFAGYEQSSSEQVLNLESARVRGILAGRLRAAIEDALITKQYLHEEWAEALRQYQGEYDEATKKSLDSAKAKAKVFVNLTKPMTYMAEAQLVDMLLPTDDKPWGMSATAVPEMQQQGDPDDVAVDATGADLVDIKTGEPITRTKVNDALLQEAAKRARAMESEIEDQLQESDYTAVIRSAIHEAAVIGTGIIQGPIATADEHGGIQPGIKQWSPWDVFPDMTATKPEDCEYIFARSFMNARQLRQFAREPGVDAAAVSRVLAAGAATCRISKDSYYDAKRPGVDNAKIQQLFTANRFELWELHVELDREDLEAVGVELPDEFKEMLGVPVIIWMVGPEILRITLPVIDAQHMNFMFWPWEADESCIFGKGVPHVMRHEQRIFNTAWRMILDNAGNAGGVQLIIDDELIEPVDGIWEIRPNKLWRKKNANVPMQNALMSVTINSVTQEVANIMQVVRSFASEVIGLPPIEQGVSANTPATMGGHSMTVTKATAPRRRQAKSFDDAISTKLIQGFFQWNMELSDKEEIKGDMRVVARAASVLLVREFQQQGLMQMLQFAGHPVFQPLGKWDEAFRQTWRSFHLPAEQFVYSPEELQGQPAQPTPEEQAAQQAQQDAAANAKSPEELAMEQKALEQKDRELDLREQTLSYNVQNANQDRMIRIIELDQETEKNQRELEQEIRAITIKEASTNHRFNQEMKVKLATGRGI